ncbi:patatin-like phospholipase family protein [Cryobacterium sp. N22]|uniref:patatin-like phospholipase family protein n=1 Tax=Cryobacterium sp. N22 TaxID=2048290 RepID=UPI001E4F8C2E|nr:patatin-like phospholipase family protein [Cryobacterium sp. N22]
MTNSSQFDPHGTAHLTPEPPTRTALVLGGGGSTGNAWLIGVIAGLVEAGTDVTGADLIVGTSAGATAAAQITGASPAHQLADVISAAPQLRSGPASPAAGRRPTRPVGDHLERTDRIIAASVDAADMRRRMGAAALDLAAVSGESGQTRWRATVASRLSNQRWPDRPLLLTAVDADTGAPVVFDRHSGVDLADAVAASCASGFAYGIGSRRYIDGGYRTNADNADLAAGYARVLVLSPFGGRTRTPADWGLHLATQVENLRAGGSRVETIFPPLSAEHLFGANAMDLSLRPPAARAGYGQGSAFAAQFPEFWR